MINEIEQINVYIICVGVYCRWFSDIDKTATMTYCYHQKTNNKPFGYRFGIVKQ